MTSDQWIVGYLGTAALVIFLMFVLVAKLAYKDGWNARGEHDQNRRNLRALRALNAPPSRLMEQPRPYVGQHAPWTPRLTVTRTATIAFAGGPATVPINHRTDSGELRALVAGNDKYIEDMRRDEAAYRRQLATR